MDSLRLLPSKLASVSQTYICRATSRCIRRYPSMLQDVEHHYKLQAKHNQLMWAKNSQIRWITWSWLPWGNISEYGERLRTKYSLQRSSCWMLLLPDIHCPVPNLKIAIKMMVQANIWGHKYRQETLCSMFHIVTVSYEILMVVLLVVSMQ